MAEYRVYSFKDWYLGTGGAESDRYSTSTRQNIECTLSKIGIWEQAVLKVIDIPPPHGRLFSELILGWYRGASSAETGEDLTPPHGRPYSVLFHRLEFGSRQC